MIKPTPKASSRKPKKLPATISSLQRRVRELEKALGSSCSQREALERRNIEIAKRRDDYERQIDEGVTSRRITREKHEKELRMFRQHVRLLIQQALIVGEVLGVELPHTPTPHSPNCRFGM